MKKKNQDEYDAQRNMCIHFPIIKLGFCADHQRRMAQPKSKSANGKISNARSELKIVIGNPNFPS